MQKIKFFLMKLFLSLGHFFRQLETDSKNAIERAVNFVNVVKTWTGTHEELINFITSAIPGNIDNIIVDKIKNLLNGLGNWKILTGDDRKLFLHNLSIKVSLILADGKLTFSDVVYLVKWYYDNHNTITPPVDLLNDNSHIAATIEATHAAAIEATPEKSNEELHAALVQKIADTHTENVPE